MRPIPTGSLRLVRSPVPFLTLLALGLAVFPALFTVQASAGELQPDRRAELILGMGPNQGGDTMRDRLSPRLFSLPPFSGG